MSLETFAQRDDDANNSYPAWIQILVLLVLVFAAYIPSLSNGFVNWDDTFYVQENPFIQSLSWNNLVAIFSQPVVANYHPLTILSLALDYRIAGLQPWIYHLDNLLMHLINTFLVFQLVRLLLGKQSQAPFWVALLFGLHPMHVESVAWVTGRKDVLFTLFYLGGLISYVKYVKEERFKWLVISFLLASLSCLSKPSAISFFVILFLLDYWFDRKLQWKLFLEKLPFALGALAIAIATINIQEYSSLQSLDQVSILQRINYASYGIVVYVLKFFIPFNLNPFHPFPPADQVPIFYYYMPFLALALIGGMFWMMVKNKWKTGLFGLIFFLITIAPTTQLITFGEAIIAERYTYLPYLGLIIALVDGLLYLLQKYPRYLSVILMCSASYATILALMSFQQTGVWKDGISLWTAAIQGGQYPTSKAYTNRGTAYAYANKPEFALEDYGEAKKLNPNEFDAYHNSGIIYYRQNRLDEALEQLNKALEIIPNNANALGNRGHVYFKKNEYDKAIQDYTASLQGNPNNAEIYNMKGFILYDRLHQPEQSLPEFAQALRLNPGYAAAYVNRSKAYMALNNPIKAKEDIEAAIKLGFVIDPAYLQEVNDALANPN